jgi:hypothetical protein
MKKRTLIAVGIVLSLSLLAAGGVFARGGDGYGMREGRGSGCWSDTDKAPVDTEAMLKFRKETLPLRDDLMAKRLELNQEYGKENPDTERIAKIRKEIVDVQMSIEKVAEKYGIEDSRQGKRSRGRYGCGNGDCPEGRF